MKLPNEVYDIIKWVCLVLAPAACALLSGLVGFWHWDIPLEAIVGTISLVATFLGAILGFSTVKYNKDNQK